MQAIRDEFVIPSANRKKGDEADSNPGPLTATEEHLSHDTAENNNTSRQDSDER